MIGGTTYEISCLECGFVAFCCTPDGSVRLESCPSCAGRAEYRKAAPASAVLFEVALALAKARAKHAPMHSPHEGHSVIREEFEELWEHVRADTGDTPEARGEAIQLAAMGCRYVLDVCDAGVPA